MRAHGWAGNPPADAEEARARIMAATRERLSASGSASTSEVAEALGVTRQTVYRYFPTTEEMLNAAALNAVADLTASLSEHVRTHLAATGGDVADAYADPACQAHYCQLHPHPVAGEAHQPGTAPQRAAADGNLQQGRCQLRVGADVSPRP